MTDVVIRFSSTGQEVVTGALRQVGAGLVTLAGQAINAAGRAFSEFAVDSVGAASDVGESLNKINVVFGSAASSVLAFASNSATALGQSEQQALEAAGTYGNLLTSIGVLPGMAADMSVSLVGLASDLSSFNNASPEETLLALRSAMTGEFEPMRRFGAALSAAAVESKALELGLAKTKEEITPAIKAQAAYALILEQTKNAQGDFANTSTGLANQQRILAAQWTDLQAQVGTALLPAMQSLTNEVTANLLPVFSELAADVLPQLIPVITEIGLAAVQFISGQLIPAFMGAVEWLRANWPTISATLAETWAQVQPILQAFGEFFSTVVLPAVAAVVAFIVTNWPTIQATIQTVMEAVQLIIRTVLVAIQAFWTEWGDEITGIIQFYVAQFQNTLSMFTKAFAGDWRGFGEDLRQGWNMLWGALIQIILDGIDAFLKIDWASIGSSIIDGIARGVAAATKGLIDAVVAAARAAVEAVQGFLGIQSPSKVFAGIGANMMLGMGAGITSTAGVPAAAAAGAASYATQVSVGAVNVYSQPGQSETAIAQEVRRQLDEYARRGDTRARL